MIPKGGVCDSVVPTALTDLLNPYPASELAGYFQRSLRDPLPPVHSGVNRAGHLKYGFARVRLRAIIAVFTL